MTDWQPIETAPESNGSKAFLAFIPGHGPCVCYSVGGRVFNNSKRRGEIHSATHWMPLPAAPESP